LPRLPPFPSFAIALLLTSGCSGALEQFEAPAGDLSSDGTPSPAPGGKPGVDAPTTARGTDPGRVTLHRLNRAEYNNTVRDLLGTALRPADDFPADDRGSGFDNVADVLSLSPLHLDMYQRSARPTRQARRVPQRSARAGDAD
jgi:hypothetical protein